jgi:hypothetical protein
MGEMSNRVELIANAMIRTLGPEFVERVTQSVNRATVVISGRDFTGEYELMTVEEKENGHWVHTDPHSGECPEK